MKIAAHTLGCKLNFAETSYLLHRFASEGHEIVDFGEIADLYFINTCTVTAIAERKCRGAIRQAIRLNNQAIVAVIGCFAQNESQQIATIPGVTIVLGNDEKHRLPEIVANLKNDRGTMISDNSPNRPTKFFGAYSTGDRTRSFLKIQDGCDYFCTYCAIPLARGRSRSATIKEVLEMAHQIAATGTKEIVLTGVNTGTFGYENGESLINLLRQLDNVDDIERYRISSIEPNLLTDEIIEFTAKSRAFLPHFHIPLQSGSNRVLQMMHRRYTRELFGEKVMLIKQLMPDACIAADIIAGFNGESNDDFEDSLSFLSTTQISYLHVFTYSERPNTAALRITPKTTVEERRKRSQVLHSLSDKKLHQFHETQIGKRRPVLWESTHHMGYMHGLTDNYIRLTHPYDINLVNSISLETITSNNIVSSAPSD